MNEEAASKKKKIILIIVAAVILLLGIILFFLWCSKITATTMRILRIEGTVTLEDDGKEKTITNNLRLNSGNALTTALKSLVSIGLDDTKIVTLDEKSRAEFNQSGRKIELNLTAGSLFFEVQKPLDNDESFDISTSTMVVGIRGTSGWVSVDGEHESLIITDGVVHVIGTNPVTGEVKEIDVKAGQRVNVYLYNDRKIDSIMFELIEVTERDLPEFLLERLRENPQLLDKVCRETGWDKPWILGVREEDVPKVVMNSDGSDDSGDDEVIPEIEDTDALAPDTGDATDTDPDDHDRDTVLTQEELDWAHSHVAIVDPATGVFALKDMTLFDPAFYAATNPDVVAKYGTDPDALLWHYLQRGKREGRPPIAPPTLTPTPTPTWVIQTSTSNPYEDEDEDDDDDDNSSSGGGGGGTPEYNFTTNPITFPSNTSGSQFNFDATTQTLLGAGVDASYIDLPVTINYTGGSKTFNSLDDVDLGTAASLTSGNLTKTDNLVYDMSTGKARLTNTPATLNLSNPAANLIVSKASDGSASTVNLDHLSSVDWANSTSGTSASMDSGTPAITYNVNKINDNEYILSDNSGNIGTYTAAALQTELTSRGL